MLEPDLDEDGVAMGGGDGAAGSVGGNAAREVDAYEVTNDTAGGAARWRETPMWWSEEVRSVTADFSLQMWSSSTRRG